MEAKLFVAAKGLIVRDGKVLVIREAKAYKDGTQTGGYDLIGGRLNPGEKFMTAFQREVHEESGIEVVVDRPLHIDEVFPVVRGEQWQVIRMFFACTYTSGEVVLSEDHDDFKWIDPRDYKTSGLIENLYPTFEAYLQMHE